MAKHPSNSYHLIEPIKTRTQVNIAEKTKGYLQYRYIVLDPEQDYPLPEDETFLKSLKTAKFRKPYDRALEDVLKAYNIPYELEMCKSCGGRVKKIVYNPIEVVE